MRTTDCISPTTCRAHPSISMPPPLDIQPVSRQPGKLQTAPTNQRVSKDKTAARESFLFFSRRPRFYGRRCHSGNTVSWGVYDVCSPCSGNIQYIHTYMY